MKNMARLKLPCVLLLNIIYVVQCLNQPEVRISQGTLRGLYTKTLKNRQIAKFEGIPYAKSPAGKHRFKNPVAAGLWYGFLNATREPPMCLQYDFFVNPPVLVGSEDCLFINVYTPEFPTDSKQSKLLDVIAFIHGGAFMIGKSGSYSPYVLLDRDVVLVTFNYRLGPLGFLSTQDDVVPGNNGLKDQVLALNWIQKNIAAFGGNPKSVTLGGFSAGGVSCHYHMLSPLSRGLFKGAICMSGIALNPIGTLKNSNEKTKLVAHELGCPTNESLLMINCLRNRPAEHIVGLSQKFLYWHSHPMAPYGPVIEPVGPEAFISQTPIDIIKNKGAADIPSIISFAADEGLVSVTDVITKTEMFNDLLNRWDELIPHVLGLSFMVPFERRIQINQRIKDFYKIYDSSEGRKNLVKMVGDCIFLSGISKLAKIYSSLYNSSMYIYKFSYRGKFSVTELMDVKEDLGVCHGDDLYYTVRDYGVFKQFEEKNDQLLSEQMLDMWVSFAANGTPGINWQPVNKQLKQIILTDIKGPNNFELSMVDELGEESFWDSLGLNENIESSKGSPDEL